MRTHEQIAADAADERPFSNSSEYEYWAGSGKGCYDCLNDDAKTEKWCPILGVALLGQWPTEWSRRTIEWSSPADASWGTPAASGSYEVVDECAEFLRRPDDDGGGDDDDPDPGPPPVIDGQVDLFEVFADEIVERASRAVVAA
jgi:hypothetical protein